MIRTWMIHRVGRGSGREIMRRNHKSGQEISTHARLCDGETWQMNAGLLSITCSLSVLGGLALQFARGLPTQAVIIKGRVVRVFMRTP